MNKEQMEKYKVLKSEAVKKQEEYLNALNQLRKFEKEHGVTDKEKIDVAKSIKFSVENMEN